MEQSSIDQLLDEKELLSARIDELEIAMIQARGAKLQRLVSELDALEDKKEELKKRIKGLETARKQAALQAAASPQQLQQQPPRKGPLKKKAPPPLPPQQQQQPSIPPKPQQLGSDAQLKSLQDELKKLEALVEEKEDEERRLRFEVEARKKELYMQEAELYEKQQRMLQLAMEADPSIKYVVKVQRIYRSRRLLRKWKGQVPRVRLVVEQYVASDEGKKLRAKWNLMMDIYRSQKQYVENMVTLRDRYAGQLKKTNHMVSGVSREEIQAIFGSCEILASFEQEILQGLYHRLFSRFTHPSIGDIFMKLVPIFGLYVDYCRNLDTAFATLARLQKSSNLFPAHIEKMYNASGNRTPLTTLLELPAQRLFQYETIFGALVQLTSPVHVDSSMFRPIHKSVCDAVAEVKALQEERKNAQLLSSLKRRISNLPDEIVNVPGRKLEQEVDVAMLVQGQKRKRVKMFVFSDVVVLAEPAMRSLKYAEHTQCLGLRYTSLMDTEDLYNGFELQSMSQAWTFACDTYEEKTQLERLLKRVIESLKSVNIDGLQKAKAFTVSGLQQARLQGEISQVSGTMTRLPKETLDKLRNDRFNGLLQVLDNAAVLRILLRNKQTAVLIAQVLDGMGRLKTVVYENFPTTEEEVVCAGNVAIDLAGAANVFLAKAWLCEVMGKLVGDMIANNADVRILSKIVVQSILENLRTVPPFLQDLVQGFRSHARKKFPKDTDKHSVLFFLSVSVFFFIENPTLFDFCKNSKKLPSAYLNAITAEITEDVAAKVLGACREQRAPLVPTTSKERCEKELWPKLLSVMVAEIEKIGHLRGVCTSLATAVALQ